MISSSGAAKEAPKEPFGKICNNQEYWTSMSLWCFDETDIYSEFSFLIFPPFVMQVLQQMPQVVSSLDAHVEKCLQRFVLVRAR